MTQSLQHDLGAASMGDLSEPTLCVDLSPVERVHCIRERSWTIAPTQTDDHAGGSRMLCDPVEVHVQRVVYVSVVHHPVEHRSGAAR